MRTDPLRLVATLVLAGLPLATMHTIAMASPSPVQRVSHVLVHPQLYGPQEVPVVIESRAETEMNSLVGVGLVSGVYPDDRVPVRAIGYENFRVWFIVPE